MAKQAAQKEVAKIKPGQLSVAFPKASETSRRKREAMKAVYMQHATCFRRLEAETLEADDYKTMFQLFSKYERVQSPVNLFAQRQLDHVKTSWVKAATKAGVLVMDKNFEVSPRNDNEMAQQIFALPRAKTHTR